jgi:hypothetical protein
MFVGTGGRVPVNHRGGGDPVFRSLLRGALAGAAGTTALNAVTYADMAMRGRPPSELPKRAVEKVAEDAGHPVVDDAGTREHRLEGLGALSGVATGVAIGMLAGVLRPLLVRLPMSLGTGLLASAAMAATDLPMARMGLTDPTSWSERDWASDVVPHLAYGAVTCATARRLAG